MEINRYLINFNTKELPREATDVVVIGCGAPALYCSLILAQSKKVTLIMSCDKLREPEPGEPDPNMVNLAADIIAPFSARDTIYGGRGLAIETSIMGYLENVQKNHDRLNEFAGISHVDVPDDKKTREHKDTVLYVAKTEHFIEAELAKAVKKNENIQIVEDYLVLDLLTKTENLQISAYGVLTKNFETGEAKVFSADKIVLAQNGYKGVFDDHYRDSYGDNIAMFLRAGGETMDMEFVHFWPMVVNSGDGKEVIIVPTRILQDGAILRNVLGERFMEKYSELGDLAPSSLVGRAIEQENKRLGADNAYLDITFKDKVYIEEMHKSLYTFCMKHNINIAKEYLPVKSKAGFCIGGIKTDENGKTSINNVYACSQDACNGFFGARLKKANLVPSKLVFAGMAADAILKDFEAPDFAHTEFEDVECNAKREIPCSAIDVENLLEKLHHNNEKNVGIIRDHNMLCEALKIVRSIKEHVENAEVTTVNAATLQNEMLISEIMIMSAIERRESRGAHFRLDYPGVNDIRWRHHIVKKLF